MRNGNGRILGSDGVPFREELVPLKGGEDGDDEEGRFANPKTKKKDIGDGYYYNGSHVPPSSSEPGASRIPPPSRTRPNKYADDGGRKRRGGGGIRGSCCRASCRDRCAIAASVAALALCGWWALSATLFRPRGRGGGSPPTPNDDQQQGSWLRRFTPWRPRSGTSSGTYGADSEDSLAETLYDELGRFIVEDYDAQPPFSDFLSALAGYYGKPLYAFYVNRGQGIASFGFESKDYPIMEFSSANVAYQTTPFVGFRTFLQASRSRSRQTFVYEPFSPLATRHLDDPATQFAAGPSSSSGCGEDGSAQSQPPKRHMYVGPNEVQIQEVHPGCGIGTNVTFFMLPEEDFGAFVKRTTITNLDRHTSLSLAVLDGLAKIEPAGGRLDTYLKTTGRTLEAWMGVYQPYNDTTSMPFFRLSMLPGDTASVVVQEEGHWCLSVLEGGDDGNGYGGFNDGNNLDFLPIVVDASKVFGDDTTLLSPVNLFRKPLVDILQEPQYSRAKTASAFSALTDVVLKPGQSVTVSTFFGKADDILQVPVYLRRITQPGFVEYKLKRSREVVNQITTTVSTRTSNKLLDGHIQQAFLDNSLRGGVPSVLGEVDDNVKLMSADEDDRLKVFHLFSRIHGDLERDYNAFQIAPTFFSQGPGNFRDVAQNRRNDVIFNPRIGDFNVRMFLSFIQADGYEPLTVEAIVFSIPDLRTCQRIAARAVGEADGHRAQREALTGILNKGPFRPGQLFLLMEEQNIELVISQQDFIDTVLAAADYSPMANFSSGYWADHFTYYQDLIDTYLAIFPEREAKLLFDTHLPYFFSPASVRPRREKYVLSLTFDGKGRHVRQLGAVVADEEKKMYNKQFIRKDTGWYNVQANWQHDFSGNVFRSTPFAKLFVLATVKFATRDAYGMGIEYEGGKPGWNDANNGLVGMLGSGMPETFELVVVLRYLLRAIRRHRRSVDVPVELYDLVQTIQTALDTVSEDYVDPEELSARVPDALFLYWDTVATARELYRERTKTTFSGDTITLFPDDVSETLKRWIGACELGIARALTFGTQGLDDSGRTGITPTYFSYNVTRWVKTGQDSAEGHPLVLAKEMVVNKFPLFLEGPTRMMKVVEPADAARIYNKVKESPLRDSELNMYTISASLQGQSFDMGREMAFSPGWLENQSVWLHMSYKFYLEMLRNGLYQDFFDEMRSGMLPFLDPKTYGRSLFECSSFIASSAFEDPAVRGRGFLARLSGSTAELLSMWALMMIGPQPFPLDDSTGQLTMQLRPALPRWMFDDSDGSPVPSISFKLFGAIDVTYYHLKGSADLFGAPPSRYVVGFLDGSTFDIRSPSIPFELADKIRRVVFVASIDAYFE